jgi:hypothetical protein
MWIAILLTVIVIAAILYLLAGFTYLTFGS